MGSNDRVSVLAPQRADRIPRQEIPFHYSGLLVSTRDRDGRWPIILGGTIYEVWLTVKTPSNRAIVFHLYKQSVAHPEFPVQLGTFTLPANTYTIAIRCDFLVQRGQTLSAAAVPAEDQTIAADALFALVLIA